MNFMDAVLCKYRAEKCKESVGFPLFQARHTHWISAERRKGIRPPPGKTTILLTGARFMGNDTRQQSCWRSLGNGMFLGQRERQAMILSRRPLTTRKRPSNDLLLENIALSVNVIITMIK
jgi:hypothetical protein